MRRYSYGWRFWNHLGVSDIWTKRLYSVIQNSKANNYFEIGMLLRSKDGGLGVLRDLFKRFSYLQKFLAILASYSTSQRAEIKLNHLGKNL